MCGCCGAVWWATTAKLPPTGRVCVLMKKDKSKTCYQRTFRTPLSLRLQRIQRGQFPVASRAPLLFFKTRDVNCIGGAIFMKLISLRFLCILSFLTVFLSVFLHCLFNFLGFLFFFLRLKHLELVGRYCRGYAQCNASESWWWKWEALLLLWQSKMRNINSFVSISRAR